MPYYVSSTYLMIGNDKLGILCTFDLPLEKFSASSDLARQTMWGRGLIRSKRIIRTIYGRSGTMHTGEKSIYGWSSTLAGRAASAVVSMPRKKMICLRGWTLNIWIKLKLNCVYGSQTPTIAMKNLWILFRSKYKCYQLSIIETLMERIEFKLANQDRWVSLLQDSQMLLRYGSIWRADLEE